MERLRPMCGLTPLIVRDGEHLSPRMAAAIAAVRSVSAELRARSG